MRTLVLTLIASGLLLAGDPFLGKWKLDVEQSQFDPGPAPMSMLMEWIADGEAVKVVTIGVRADGEAFRQQYTALYDGKERASPGPWNFNRVVNRRLSDTEREDVFKKDGLVLGNSKLVLSQDGKRLTIEMKFADSRSIRIFRRE